jgi:Flp pilus assembly protein TadG
MPAHGRSDERGSVTVEAALGLCSLVVVLALVLAAVSAVVAQVRCVDAAREAARLTARGERDRGEELARQIAPRVSANPVAGLLPGIDVRAEAAAIMEPVNER